MIHLNGVNSHLRVAIAGASILYYSVAVRSDDPKELLFLPVPCHCDGYNDQCVKRWHGGG